MDHVKMYMMMLENQHHLNNYQNSIRNVYPINQNIFEIQSDQSIAKSNKVKICRCCGDIAKSFHFGALCCCSCKAFFRRSVQNESYRSFHCPYNSNCEITVLSRKCCQFCRFEKCVRIGMEKSWVMSEEERIQLLKSRMLKKQKKEQDAINQSIDDDSSRNSEGNSREPIEYYPDYGLINRYLTDNEIVQIERLVNDYLMSCVQIQPKFLCNQTLLTDHQDKIKFAESDEDIIKIFLNNVYQFTRFAKKLTFFQNLNLHDQQILLRNSIIELCFLLIAFCFDKDMFYRVALCKIVNHSTNDENQLVNNQMKTQNDDFQINSNQNKENRHQLYDYRFSKKPILKKEDLKQFLDEQLSDKFFSFIKQIQECNIDDVIIILMALIVLHNPECNQLIDSNKITTEQEYFLDLLERYIHWKFGSNENQSSTLFAKLLITLPSLREASELFAEFQLESNVLDRFNFDEINHLGNDFSSSLVENDHSNYSSIKLFKIKDLAD